MILRASTAPIVRGDQASRACRYTATSASADAARPKCVSAFVPCPAPPGCAQLRGRPAAVRSRRAAQPDRPAPPRRPDRQALRRALRQPHAQPPSPRARRRRSPPAATERRRPPPARSTRRAGRAARSRPPPARGRAAARRRRSRAASPRSPRGTRGCPSPRSGGRRRGRAAARPARRPRPGSRRRSGIDLAPRRAPRRARLVGEERWTPRSRPRARRTIGRKSHGARRASSTSVPQTWSTNGFPVASAAIPDGIQCACTRSASRAARRAARAYAARNAGSASTSHGCARRFWTIPPPKAIPKWRKSRGRDDVDLDARGAHVLDRLGDEPARRRRRPSAGTTS